MFIFYIYDKTDGFILKSFTDEKECTNAFNDLIRNAECFLPVSWIGINLAYYHTFE